MARRNRNVKTGVCKQMRSSSAVPVLIARDVDHDPGARAAARASDAVEVYGTVVALLISVALVVAAFVVGPQRSLVSDHCLACRFEDLLPTLTVSASVLGALVHPLVCPGSASSSHLASPPLTFRAAASAL